MFNILQVVMSYKQIFNISHYNVVKSYNKSISHYARQSKAGNHLEAHKTCFIVSGVSDKLLVRLQLHKLRHSLAPRSLTYDIETRLFEDFANKQTDVR